MININKYYVLVLTSVGINKNTCYLKYATAELADKAKGPNAGLPTLASYHISN